MPTSKHGQSSITVRCTSDEKKKITEKWQAAGFKTEAEYVRFVCLNANIEVKVSK